MEKDHSENKEGGKLRISLSGLGERLMRLCKSPKTNTTGIKFYSSATTLEDGTRQRDIEKKTAIYNINI